MSVNGLKIKKGLVMDEIIDLKEALERVQEDKELLNELFDIYMEDFATKRQALGQALISRDMTKIKEIAHSMKGSSGNISAKPMHAACLKIEVMAKEGKTDGIQELLVDIDGYFERIKDFVARYKKDMA
ncbi:MAG: Hpt domain-containing protein [Candidatus Omnitrophica bacterium]|nr:Hpt domain-containing protein [Candidatus Omnitrophota bacterium]